MTRTAVHAPGAPAPVGPYSHAVVARGELVHLSGQTPIDPATGRLVEGGVAEQVRRVLANLDQVLGAAGLTFADVVKVNVYLTDMADFAAMNEVYGTVFAAPAPGADHRRRGRAPARRPRRDRARRGERARGPGRSARPRSGGVGRPVLLRLRPSGGPPRRRACAAPSGPRR